LAILIVSVFLHLPPTEQSPTTFKARLYRVDFLGAFVLVVAVLSFLIGLDQASDLSLTSPLVIGGLSIALVFFLALMYVESFVAAEPLAPPHIVKQPTILASCLANFFSLGANMTMLFYVPLYYQASEALSAHQAGLRLLPAIAGAVLGSLSGGIIVQKTGRFYWLTLFVYTLSTLGGVLVVISSARASHVGISIGILFTGFGNGAGVTTTLVALIAAAGNKDQAVATAVSYLFRALGTVAGVSIGSALVQGQLRRELAKRLTGDDTDEIVRKVRESLEFIGTLPEGTREIVRACYKDAVRMSFTFAVALAVCAIVSAAFIKEKKLRR